MPSHALEATEHTQESYLDVKGRHTGIFGWIFSVDHKRIGLLYLGSVFLFFTVAIFLGLFMRLEQLTMGETLMSPNTYNRLFTLHGVIMVFLFIIPGIAGTLGNFFLPIQIGAKDVFFPRLNLLSWWLYMAGALLAILAIFTGEGMADTGWTFYVPYSAQTSTNVSLALSAAFILGFSSILTGLNFIATVHRMRAPGMTFHRMPLFIWGLYATAWIQVLATPIVGITLVLVILERTLGIGIFDPAMGGDPILYQHLFWIYSHPAVYLMVLPGMGIISEIIPTFCRRTIFGYKAIAWSSVGIAGVGTFVWGHHMYVSGQSETAAIIFSFLTFFVAIPTAIKVFNWIATMYKASIRIEVPFLYALAFLSHFLIGGLTGLMNAAVSVDVHVHDTYFVVGHFHYTMFGGTVFALFGGLYYWGPKMWGRMYNKKTAIVAFILQIIGFNTLYLTMIILGWEGMPRRYYDHLPQFHTEHIIATVGSWFLVSGLLLMIITLLYSIFKGPKAPQNPWGGTTLEWQIPTPPPLENFDVIPTITEGPYVHKVEGA
ncbi:cbb3-type cytochrome c oxidase subunit I [candidate division KSB1 bacterium]|nr:cbb3-type cytochrome c oxidase subunit I [candidate division KSB1 bacterium]